MIINKLPTQKKILLARRRAMMGRHEIQLPSGAVEVEYLQGDGNAYIVLSQRNEFRLTSQKQTIWEGKIGIGEINTQRKFIFCYENIGNVHYSEISPRNVFCCSAGSRVNNWTEPVLAVGSMYWAQVRLVAGSPCAFSKIEVDGQIYEQQETYATYVDSSPINLFRLASGYQGKGQRIGRSKLYYDGGLVRDLIPCRIGETGYMYDRISDILYGNASDSGAFILGPDI